MGYKDITPGVKTATIKGARFVKSKKGTLGMEVLFAFDNEQMNWTAWLTQNSITRSMDTLVHVLGFNGNDSCDGEGILTDPNAFDYGRQVSLIVEPEEYEGKTHMKIKWVNPIGGGGFGKCDPQTLPSDLESVGFTAAFLAAKQSTEIPF